MDLECIGGRGIREARVRMALAGMGPVTDAIDLALLGLGHLIGRLSFTSGTSVSNEINGDSSAGTSLTVEGSAADDGCTPLSVLHSAVCSRSDGPGDAERSAWLHSARCVSDVTGNIGGLGLSMIADRRGALTFFSRVVVVGTGRLANGRKKNAMPDLPV